MTPVANTWTAETNLVNSEFLRKPILQLNYSEFTHLPKCNEWAPLYPTDFHCINKTCDWWQKCYFFEWTNIKCHDIQLAVLYLVLCIICNVSFSGPLILNFFWQHSAYISSDEHYRRMDRKEIHHNMHFFFYQSTYLVCLIRNQKHFLKTVYNDYISTCIFRIPILLTL